MVGFFPAQFVLLSWNRSFSCLSHVLKIFIFVERKQVKRFAPPPVRLQIEKQLASQACASNTEKVWQLADNLATPDIHLYMVIVLAFLHFCNKPLRVLQCGSVEEGKDNSEIVIADCLHEM